MLFTSNCVSLFSLCCTFQKWAVFLEWFKINSCLLHSLCISIGRQMNHITNSLCPWICPPCPFRPHKGKILIFGLLYIIEYNKQETIPSGQSGGWHIALEGKKWIIQDYLWNLSLGTENSSWHISFNRMEVVLQMYFLIYYCQCITSRWALAKLRRHQSSSAVRGIQEGNNLGDIDELSMAGDVHIQESWLKEGGTWSTMAHAQGRSLLPK